MALQIANKRLRTLSSSAHVGKPADVHLRVGHVVRHRKYGFRGVVIGYDATCQATDSWMEASQVKALPLGPHQPFYHVLIDSRDALTWVKSRWAAKDSLAADTGGAPTASMSSACEAKHTLQTPERPRSRQTCGPATHATAVETHRASAQHDCDHDHGDPHSLAQEAAASLSCSPMYLAQENLELLSRDASLSCATRYMGEYVHSMSRKTTACAAKGVTDDALLSPTRDPGIASEAGSISSLRTAMNNAILNPLLDRYFTTYRTLDMCFTPCSALEAAYPDDATYMVAPSLHHLKRWNDIEATGGTGTGNGRSIFDGVAVDSARSESLETLVRRQFLSGAASHHADAGVERDRNAESSLSEDRDGGHHHDHDMCVDVGLLCLSPRSRLQLGAFSERPTDLREQKKGC